MRGLYTAGVLDVMMEHGFMPDVACGTSAGVTFGINLLSQQKGRVLRYNTRFAGDKRYISLHSLVHTGDMVNVEFAYDLLPRVLDPFDEQAFEASGCDFYATVTNVRTGLPEYISITNCWEQMDVIRASASLPFLSRKVCIGAEKYLDGGIVDNIPLQKCLDLGCDKIVVVLTRPKGMVVDDHITLLSKLWYPHDKELQHAIARRNANYRKRVEQIEELEQKQSVFVIRPSRFIQTGRLESNPDVLRAMHGLGVDDARNCWSALQAYLKQGDDIANGKLRIEN